MTFWLNVFKYVSDLSIRANDNRIPPDLSGLGTGVVGPADLAVDIGQQGVWKLILSSEGCVGLFRVHTDTQNLGVQGLKFADSITESGPLNNSARCVGFRIEP